MSKCCHYQHAELAILLSIREQGTTDTCLVYLFNNLSKLQSHINMIRINRFVSAEHSYYKKSKKHRTFEIGKCIYISYIAKVNVITYTYCKEKLLFNVVVSNSSRVHQLCVIMVLQLSQTILELS